MKQKSKLDRYLELKQVLEDYLNRHKREISKEIKDRDYGDMWMCKYVRDGKSGRLIFVHLPCQHGHVTNWSYGDIK